MSLHISINPKVGLLYVRGEGSLEDHDVNGYYPRLKGIKGAKQCQKALISLNASDVSLKKISSKYQINGLDVQGIPGYACRLKVGYSGANYTCVRFCSFVYEQ